MRECSDDWRIYLGANIEVAEAIDHIFGYGVGVDLTARDLQLQAKKVGQIVESGESLYLIDYAQDGNPWDLSKGCELTNIIESSLILI